MTLVSMGLIALRAALFLGVVLAALRVMTRASAATRRSMLVASFAIVLVMPVASAFLPALHLRGAVPSATMPPVVVAVPDTVVEADAVNAVTAAPALHVSNIASSAGVSPVAIALVLWALGAFAVLARLAVGIVRAHRLAMRARFVETLDVGGRPVQIRVSSVIETPAVTGLFVPVVLLPRDAKTWTAERHRIVIAHEMAHIANRDCLANVIAQLAVALHWFDPLVWIAARRLRVERELAADDRVLDQGVVASTYAEHLLALATSDEAVPAGVLAMAGPSQLSTRLRALLSPRRAPGAGRAILAVRAVGLGIAALVACATPERDEATPPAAAARSQAAAPGSTVDPNIQTIVEQELERMNTEWSPCAAVALVLDPHTGAVLAAAYRGGNEPSAEHAAVRPMVPGSVIKPLLVAAALEEGVIKPTDHFDATPDPLSMLVDSEPHGMLDVGEILAVSSNVGAGKIFDRIGGAKLAAWDRRFHLASTPSQIPDGTDGARFAIGARFSSTPLEVSAAFATLANGGVYHAPTFTPARDDGERVLHAETATAVLALLEGVTGERGTGSAARVTGVRVAGKTGTSRLGQGPSDIYASFVGAAPLEAPRYVIFIGAETPRDGGSGGQVAAPVFRRIMARLLAH